MNPMQSPNTGVGRKLCADCRAHTPPVFGYKVQTADKRGRWITRSTWRGPLSHADASIEAAWHAEHDRTVRIVPITKESK